MAYFQDTFTGADGTVLNVHDSNYSFISTGNISNATIESNNLEYSSFTKAVARYSGVSGNDLSSLILRGGVDQLRVGPGLRSSASNEGYTALFEIFSSPNYTRLALYKDGSRIAFKTVSFSSASDITLRIEATDNAGDVDLEIFVNDVSEITHTDPAASTPLPSGNPSIYLGNTAFGLARVDDFTSGVAPSGITLTAPDIATEGDVENVTGTDLDTITTFSLQTDDETHSIVQDTWADSSDVAGTFTAESGANDATPGSEVSGVPLEPTVSAVGITAYQIQMKADDGVTPSTRDITLNGETGHDNLQIMVATSNVTEGESICAPSISVIEDNDQFYVPDNINGMNITWAADGTFTTDADQTETITMKKFSPSTGEWSAKNLTITQSSITPTGDREIVRVVVDDIVVSVVRTVS